MNQKILYYLFGSALQGAHSLNYSKFRLFVANDDIKIFSRILKTAGLLSTLLNISSKIEEAVCKFLRQLLLSVRSFKIVNTNAMKAHSKAMQFSYSVAVLQLVAVIFNSVSFKGKNMILIND